MVDDPTEQADDDARSASETPTAPAPSGDGDGPPPEHGFSRGASVDRYTILERIGAGGMGEVYAAYDSKLDRKVALKILLLGGRDHEARLTREAQAMARLSHPNVVGVFDTGKVGERLFLAMEFVQGRTLGAWRRERSRPVDQIVSVFVEAGRGLAAAHAAGLVHRDFKPDNVLVSLDGQVKVTDFGVVRAAEEHPVDPALRALAARLSSRPPPPATTEPTVDAPEPTSVPSPPPTPSFDPAGSLDPSLAPMSAPSSPTPLWEPMTEMGSMVGTPGYMAPEQYLGTAVDPRTDQFSFCAALYEAIYQQKPFRGRSMTQLAESTVLGQIRPPPRGADGPAHVHRALMRGLAIESADRYPSMEALLADLLRDPARRRRRVAAWIGAGVAVCALFAGTQRFATARQGGLCSDAGALAGEVWNDDVRGRVERSLLATGVPYAADTFRRTRAQLDGYMQRWSAAHEQTCRATRVDGSQSEQVMTVRMACLEQRRQDVHALAQVLSTADRDVAAKAHQASLELGELDACKNVTSLMSAPPEPTDPTKRGELTAVRAELPTVRAKVEAGRTKDAALEVAPLVDRARAIGYPPLLAEVLFWAASARIESGAPKDEVLAQGAEAVYQADLGRDDATRAAAATFMMRRSPPAGHYAEAEQWSKVADAALQRAGDVGLGRAKWLEARGWLADGQGRYKNAVEYRAEALEVARRSGADPRFEAEVERGLGAERARIGEKEEARRLAAEADEKIVRVLGESHPARIPFIHGRAFVAGLESPREGSEFERQAIDLAERVAPGHSLLATMYNNVCDYSIELGDYEGARATCELSIERAKQIWGEEAPILAYAYSNLGEALSRLHRYEEATPHYEHAIALTEKLGAERSTNYFDSLRGLGMAELGVGKVREATEHLERAVASGTTLEDKSAEAQERFAQASFGLARALWQGGSRAPRIAALTQAAQATFEAIGKQDAAREVDAWRAEHKPPGT